MATLLQETLREEQETDKQLATVAKRLMKEAVRPSPLAQDSAASKTGKKSAPASKAASAGGGSKGKGAGRESTARARASAASENEPLSHTTTNHDEIRAWAEARGGMPACVQGTGGKGDIGVMRIEFPGAPRANDDQLEVISWDEFFDKFDERGLALVYQERTAAGEQSNFNKLISAEEGHQKKAHAG
jgi:hypothetical protein